MLSTVALLKRMMAFKPVSSEVKNTNRLVDFLKAYLAKNGVFTRVEKWKGRKILYAATHKGKASPVMFNTHLDVVPAADDFFALKEKNGWVWGRGTGDCLGNSAVLTHLLIRLKGKAKVGVLYATDEEIGGYTTKAMADKGYKGDFVIITDSTGKGYDLAVAQKGILTLKLKAQGKACHGSSPWLGKNAIDRLIEGYLRVRPLFPAIRQGDEWHTSMSANVMHAGTVFNRVPDEAEIILDIRYTEATPPDELVRKIRARSGLTVETLVRFPMVGTDERHPAIRDFVKTMERHLKRRVPFVRLNGATDARHLEVLKVPVAIISIPYVGAHASDERAEVKGMKRYEDMLADYCLEQARIART
ncbi:MAG: M20/M25/M40 family metallo-hydrolase [Lentisphaerae bacterium]|nr:M20/M25/M40 family metallo-hydrolase [Lentisphaerota bacterium]